MVPLGPPTVAVGFRAGRRTEASHGPNGSPEVPKLQCRPLPGARSWTWSTAARAGPDEPASCTWPAAMAAGRASHTSALTGRPTRIRRIAARGAAIAGGVLLLLVVWGAGIEPRLVDEREETVVLPGLPPAWGGQRVAFIADLQVGMWLANTDTIRRIVARVVEDRPAALLIGGDFLYHPTEESGEPREAREELERDDVRVLRTQIRQVVSLLEPVTAAGIATIAVLGNHDYAMRRPDSLQLPAVANELTEVLRAAGVTVLRNEAVALAAPGTKSQPLSERLYVAGLDEWAARATDVKATLAQIPDDQPRLLLMHDPLAFQQLPAGSAPVALAAHTQGADPTAVPASVVVDVTRGRSVRCDGWVDREGLWGRWESPLRESRYRVQCGSGARQLPS